MIVTITDIVRAAKGAGFTYGAGLQNAVAISCAENPLHDTTATFTNTDGSIDRGLWQINNKWHAEVTDACAFDLNCSAKATFTISAKGTNFGAWATYQSGKYKNYRELALTAIQLVESQDQAAALQAQITTLKSQITSLQNQVTSQQTTITNQNNQITSLQSQLASANNTISSLQSQVTNLQGQITSTQAALDAANAKIASDQQVVTGAREALQSIVATGNNELANL
jgi:peptidoglycan hydrolase CwlO-like protein